MNTRRIGRAAVVVAMSTLTACSTWQGMTDRLTGRGTAPDTARATGTSGATVPGADVSRMRDPTVPPTAGPGRPTFRSYDECRAWLAQQGREMNRGPATGGEVSMADTDPCRNLPRS